MKYYNKIKLFIFDYEKLSFKSPFKRSACTCKNVNECFLHLNLKKDDTVLRCDNEWRDIKLINKKVYLILNHYQTSSTKYYLLYDLSFGLILNYAILTGDYDDGPIIEI